MNEVSFRIGHASLLRRLAPGDLLDLVNGCSLPTFSPDEIIVREGGVPVEVFLLLSGQVSVRRVDPRGQTYLLALREPGDWIGVMGIVRRTAHSATVVAETHTRTLAIPKEAFVRVVLALPAAAGDLLEIVANRLVESDDARLRRFELDEKTDGRWDGQEASASAGRIELGEDQSFHEATRIFQARLIQQTDCR